MPCRWSDELCSSTSKKASVCDFANRHALGVELACLHFWWVHIYYIRRVKQS
jgi:hypothetical protein